MVKRAQGFLTSDNRFFNTKEEARYAEAATTLFEALERRKVDASKFKTICESHFSLVKEYIDAYAALPSASKHPADTEEGQEQETI